MKWAREKVQAAVDRYGVTGTLLVLACCLVLLPVPFPGTSVLPVLLANWVTRPAQGDDHVG